LDNLVKIQSREKTDATMGSKKNPAGKKQEGGPNGFGEKPGERLGIWKGESNPEPLKPKRTPRVKNRNAAKRETFCREEEERKKRWSRRKKKEKGPGVKGKQPSRVEGRGQRGHGCKAARRINRGKKKGIEKAGKGTGKVKKRDCSGPITNASPRIEKTVNKPSGQGVREKKKKKIKKKFVRARRKCW